MSDLSELVSVLVCTSPTASDPDTTAIEETIVSARTAPEMNRCLLLIGADGIRPEQRDLTTSYHAKLAELDYQWPVARLPAWGHQANVMRMLLEHVTTPLVLALEHDAPLTADVAIDWSGCAETVMSGELHLIRFLHESRILPDYAHLMLQAAPTDGTRVPYIRTAQWSQRPHLAATQWYRDLIATYFGPSSRCFVEDALHGVVTYHWNEFGSEGLDRFKMGIYADPVPTLQRSYHLDGRGAGSKYEQCFAYPGDTWPEGAPAPTLGRVFEG